MAIKISEAYSFTCDGCGKESLSLYARPPIGWTILRVEHCGKDSELVGTVIACNVRCVGNAVRSLIKPSEANESDNPQDQE